MEATMESLPNGPDTTVSVSCVRDQNWYGFPFEMVTSPETGDWNDPYLPTYWMSFIIAGRCATRLGTKSRQKDIIHSPGTFAAYPAGRHWDKSSFVGRVTVVSLACDWKLLRKSRLLEADDLPRLDTIYPCGSDPGLTSIISCMLREYEDGSPSGRLYAESLSLALAARLNGMAQEDDRQFLAEGLGRQRARIIRDFIEGSLAEDLCVADLARLVGISPSRFASLFKNSFSTSVHQFVLNRRIERASSLLSMDGYRNADIAAGCGFASESHFSDTFKRITGVSPRNYRRAGASIRVERVPKLKG
jgi:AraC-like DNA-binding protein